MKSLPASSFSADSGNGLIRRHRTTCARTVVSVGGRRGEEESWARGSKSDAARTCSTWPMPRSCRQSFLSVLTQISPVFEMFGWKIFVRK